MLYLINFIWISTAFLYLLFPPEKEILIKDFPKAFQDLPTEPLLLPFLNNINIDQSGGHLQGVQLYKEKGQTYAYLSGSSASKSFMAKVKLDAEAKVTDIFNLMPEPYRHAGGFQIYKQFLAIGIEDNHLRTSSKILIYDVNSENDPWKNPLYTIERQGTFEMATAGAVGITQFKDEMLLAVANWDCRNIDFYTCPSNDFKKRKGEFVKIASIETATISREDWSDDFWRSYQNINLFTDAKNNLYMAAYARDDKGANIADVFQIVMHTKKDKLNPKRDVKFTKTATKSFNCKGGPDFRAGAGIYISEDGSLGLASCSYQIGNRSVLNIFAPSNTLAPWLGMDIERLASNYWVKTREMPAPEAVQAAAATMSHIFAVNNRQIAKYDRETGKRVAISKDDSQHLNSGFFWEGKLYCAHSNYPQKPDRSDIRVLDPKDMELKIYKDFGESEGSLTWAIRQDGYWWCMFAFYGEENGKSYLARFDDGWKETGRWLFPTALIEKLGNMSVSGGIWWKDGFLVTSHDDRELHYIRIPKSGNRLEYLETIPAPFWGQGIALDPATGGLVGIDRPERKIIFAELHK